jgi:hypothetical protein
MLPSQAATAAAAGNGHSHEQVHAKEAGWHEPGRRAHERGGEAPGEAAEKVYEERHETGRFP